jgi:aminoglycoside phosphotransferase (APT) family kinase protein
VTGLKAALASNGYTADHLVVLSRKKNHYASTFASEIVKCQLRTGHELQLFCKYSSHHDKTPSDDRKIRYEADVYRHVLQPRSAPVPQFYGSYHDTETGGMWLIIENVAQSARMNKTQHAAAEHLAVRWLGNFHAINEVRLLSAPPYLATYDLEHYAKLASRASRAARHRANCQWLETVCDHFEELAASLLTARPTLIHGEFYPANILVQGDTVYPIDWESAAIAAGEIDLASLLENWPAEELSGYLLEYRRTRWPQGAPDDFERAFYAAQVYWALRWLGDPIEIPTKDDWKFYLNVLHDAAQRLSLI